MVTEMLEMWLLTCPTDRQVMTVKSVLLHLFANIECTEIVLTLQSQKTQTKTKLHCFVFVLFSIFLKLLLICWMAWRNEKRHREVTEGNNKMRSAVARTRRVNTF